MLAVVPANAGTHTPRLLSLSAAARRLSNNEHRWLWVPAFAGTTMELEQMASSRTPSTRRPCERRDPYAAAFQLERCGATAFQPRTSVVMGPCFRRADELPQLIVAPPSITMVWPVVNVPAFE